MNPQIDSDPTDAAPRLLAEQVRDLAVLLLDAEGVVTHWGEGAERMTGLAAETAVGSPLAALYPAGLTGDGTAEEHLRIAAEQGEYTGEGQRAGPGGALFPARVVLTALRRDGELVGFGQVMQDLTGRHGAEAELREALRAAEAASVEKSRFLATMSHEIRTPINAVLGYAELLDLGLQGILTHGQASYVHRIQASGRHLLALIEDVLDYARAEAGRLAVNARRASMADVADLAIDALRPQAEGAGVALESTCGAAVHFWGDERRALQILNNLVGNAVKFTRAGGRVEVTCGNAARVLPPADVRGPGPWTWTRVEDTGVGIPAEQLESVFEPFVQVDNSLTREHPGTGLGLAIARRLARLMGGDLVAESREGEGSAFTLWLPADATSAAEPTMPAEEGNFAGLTRAGAYLAGAAVGIVRASSERMRADPEVPDARERSRSELEDHLLPLLSDVAQSLVILGEDGPEAPAIARDGTDLQTFIAQRHGLQRRRLGWTADALRRESLILREEAEAVVRQSRGAVSDLAVDGAVEVVRRLLTRAEAASLAAFEVPPPA